MLSLISIKYDVVMIILSFSENHGKAIIYRIGPRSLLHF
jgi:hypothetical protein